MTIPVHRGEQTGDPVLDRVQNNVRSLILAMREIYDRVAALEAAAPISVMLRDDFTTTAATAQNTLLSFPVKAGECWDVDYYGAAGCAGDALGMKYAIAAPPSTVISGYLDSNLTSATDDTHPPITAVNTLTSAVHTVNGATRPDHINVRLKAGESGNVTLQACSTTAGRTTTILAKAFIRAVRVTEVGT